MGRINLYTLLFIAFITITEANGQVQEIYESPNYTLSSFNKKFNTKYSVVEEVYPGFYQFSPETDRNNPGAMAKYGITDKNNTVLVEPKFEMFDNYSKSGIVKLYSVAEGKTHLYSLKTKSMLYEDIQSSSSYREFLINKHIVFEFNDSYGAFDFKGNLIYQPVYQKILVHKGIVYLLKDKTLSNSKNNNEINKVKDFKLDKEGILVYKRRKKHNLYNFDLSSSE